jgi:hypothetical protein
MKQIDGEFDCENSYLGSSCSTAASPLDLSLRGLRCSRWGPPRSERLRHVRKCAQALVGPGAMETDREG